MRPFVVASIALWVGLEAARAATIGQATSVQNDVTGELAAVVQRITPGGAVSANELVRTGAASAAMLRFLDQSNLNIGATSVVRLDNFVFNPDQTAQSRVVNLATGALRFVSGGSEPKGVAISTPVATITIRGTDLVVVCELNVRCAILLASGLIRVCPWPIEVKPPDNCPDAFDLDPSKNFVMVGQNGATKGPLHIDTGAIGSVIETLTAGNPVPAPVVLALQAGDPDAIHAAIGLIGGGGAVGLGLFLIPEKTGPISP